MPTFKVVGKKRKSRGLSRRAVAQMIKYPPSEYASIKVPRDPGARKEFAKLLAQGDAMGDKGMPMGRSPQGQWLGKGDYSQLWGATQGLRSLAGGWLRGGGSGTWRKAAGDFMGYTGMGDYDRTGAVDNSLVGGGQASAGIPMFGPEQQNYTVSKAEFISNIYAPSAAGAFQNLVLPLNPGLPQTFPWLSLVAPQFEEYEFEQLIFYYRPMVSDFNSSTGQVGEIVMCTQYNPSEPQFSDISRAKNYMGAMSAKTSIAMNQGVECDPRKNSGAPGKYVRLGPLTGTNNDLKQYDQGNLNVMVSGTPPAYNDQILGELWVTYTVTLRKPKLPDTSGAAILRDYFQSSLATPALPLAPPACSLILASDILEGAQNRFQGSIAWTTVVDGAVTHLVCQYTFPEWFTGAAEIDTTWIGVFGANSGAMWGPTSDSAASVVPPGGGITFLGQVKPIPDIGTLACGSLLLGQPLYDAGVSATFPLSSCGVGGQGFTGGAAVAANFVSKIHVQVSENTTGQDNAVRWKTISYQTAMGEPSAAGYTVNVQEYNSAFNSPNTGQPLLVDVEGNPVLSPWVTP